MIKVKDTPEVAHQIYTQITVIFEQKEINPLPINYLVWYHFLKGENTHLINEIKAVIESPYGYTDRLGTRLYDQYIAEESIKAEDQYDFAFRQFVDDILNKIGTWVCSLDQHSDQMGLCVENLKKPNLDAQDLERMAATIMQTVTSMQSSTNEIRSEAQTNTDEVTLLRQQLHKARAEALTDELTQIGNRKSFNATMMDLTLENRSQPHTLCLIMTDIDHFKKFNDTYGHPIGDSVLRYFASIMRKSASENETICRYGGEEFAIIIKNSSLEEACARAEVIRQQIQAARLTLKNSSDPIDTITASFGISHFYGHEDCLEDFIGRADKSLYAAKHAGRNQVIHEDMMALN